MKSVNHLFFSWTLSSFGNLHLAPVTPPVWWLKSPRFIFSICSKSHIFVAQPSKLILVAQCSTFHIDVAATLATYLIMFVVASSHKIACGNHLKNHHFIIFCWVFHSARCASVVKTLDQKERSGPSEPKRCLAHGKIVHFYRWDFNRYPSHGRFMALGCPHPQTDRKVKSY